MKLAKNPTLRRLFLKSSLQPRYQQRRWAKTHDVRFNDVRFLATQSTTDRIIEKYREKLGRKAKDEGHNDLGSLREAYKAKIDSIKKEAITAGFKKSAAQQSTTQASTQIPFSPPPAPEPTSPTTITSKSSTPSGVKTLSSFIDIPKTLSLPLKEIEYIWRLRHAHKPNSLCAAIPGEAFAHMSLLARKYPQFVLPVPRDSQGAEIHFLQWTFPQADTATVLFTQLAEYKLRGEYAAPHTTVSLHSELLKPKGIVLAQGAVMENRGISVDDGKWLFMCLQKFYGVQVGEEKGRRRLLEQFAMGDEGFQIQELLDEAERLG